MKVPVRWLNDYVRIDDISIKELADSFLSIGFEVEEIIDLGKRYQNMVCGRICSLEKHPDANNLSIVMLDIGEAEKVCIVTGAKNVAVGDVVPVALDGAVVAGGKEIKACDFRGVRSYGMLCSGKELDIDDNTIEGAEVNGILILPSQTKPGLSLAVALDMDEYVFDISINSNRPDCNSIVGLARELSVKLNRPLAMPSLDYKTVAHEGRLPNVNIDKAILCSRYHANAIFDVKIARSPSFVLKRLLAAGVRPINNVVDITNFVLLEMGQPLHAFDLESVDGDIFVRTARDNETLLALNDQEYKLDKSMLVIADSKKPLAIAGVMGGESSAISDATKAVLLETARFAKSSVRYTSRSLGLRSDSSARFERGVDYQSVDLGKNRALSLIDSLGVGKIMQACSIAQCDAPPKKMIRTSVNQINSILGIQVPANEVIRILRSLDFEIEFIKNQCNCENNNLQSDSLSEFDCIVPLHREDVDSFADLSEEVIRFFGYDNIVSSNMENATLTIGGIPQHILGMRRLKNVLCGAGLYEIINFSFIGASDCQKLNIADTDPLRQQIKIVNPLGEDRAFMRTQLVSSMIKTLQLNASRQNDSVGLFEISKVFLPKSLPLTDLPCEPQMLCVGLLGKQFDFYYLKNIVRNIFGEFSINFEIARSTAPWLHSGICADIIVNQKIVGSFGKIHPLVSKSFETSEDIFVLQINIEDIISRPLHIAKATALPKYPAVDRDLAVVVRDSVSAGDIIAAIRDAAESYLEEVKLFDVYSGGQIEAGYKSMAFSLRLRNMQKTLEEAELVAIMNNVVDTLKNSFDAKLR